MWMVGLERCVEHLQEGAPLRANKQNAASDMTRPDGSDDDHLVLLLSCFETHQRPFVWVRSEYLQCVWSIPLSLEVTRMWPQRPLSLWRVVEEVVEAATVGFADVSAADAAARKRQRADVVTSGGGGTAASTPKDSDGSDRRFEPAPFDIDFEQLAKLTPRDRFLTVSSLLATLTKMYVHVEKNVEPMLRDIDELNRIFYALSSRIYARVHTPCVQATQRELSMLGIDSASMTIDTTAAAVAFAMTDAQGPLGTPSLSHRRRGSYTMGNSGHRTSAVTVGSVSSDSGRGDQGDEGIWHTPFGRMAAKSEDGDVSRDESPVDGKDMGRSVRNRGRGFRGSSSFTHSHSASAALSGSSWGWSSGVSRSRRRKLVTESGRLLQMKEEILSGMATLAQAVECCMPAAYSDSSEDEAVSSAVADLEDMGLAIGDNR